MKNSIGKLTDDFVKVAETKDIQASQMKEVQFDNEDVCIAWKILCNW